MADRITDEELAAIKERLEKATPGPWESTDGDVWIDTRECVCCGRGSIHGCCGEPDVSGGQELLAQSNPTDADFIAHARTDIPALLSHIAFLTSQLASVRNDALEEAAKIAEETAEGCHLNDGEYWVADTMVKAIRVLKTTETDHG